MADWKNDLKILADKLRTEQKNKKGFQSKFQHVVGYKGKLGFNDTGVPLTAKAAKSLERNRAAYTGRRSRRTNYEGSTLQQINEERAAAARERWKHLDKKPGSRHSSDKAPTKKEYSSSELMWRSSASRVGESSWYNQPTTFKGYGYDNPPQEEKKIIDYIWVEPKAVDSGANYKEGRFPKLDEAIRNAKRGKR
tara:strand:+ start:752 stop:1333 length:582 start_codon:yes stop_codon:yes gene_type:complete